MHCCRERFHFITCRVVAESLTSFVCSLMGQTVEGLTVDSEPERVKLRHALGETMCKSLVIVYQELLHKGLVWGAFITHIWS